MTKELNGDEKKIRKSTGGKDLKSLMLSWKYKNVKKMKNIPVCTDFLCKASQYDAHDITQLWKNIRGLNQLRTLSLVISSHVDVQTPEEVVFPHNLTALEVSFTEFLAKSLLTTNSPKVSSGLPRNTILGLLNFLRQSSTLSKLKMELQVPNELGFFIPKCIKTLRSLDLSFMSSSKMSGDDLLKLSEFITKLNSLSSLHLSLADLRIQQKLDFSSHADKLIDLKLHLMETKLDSVVISDLFLSLQTFRQLRTICLHFLKIPLAEVHIDLSLIHI
eukprot:TRINITY_DN24669_c0_g1_i2.p1 TRINITY_DN24669_c0_g1~~TRINITY_DN24669_c0_g1_i2.p1  ORF type:complete len:275 (-),score=21.65 TRINITY_DN24669_c0_g1_i2:60-884(-)